MRSSGIVENLNGSKCHPKSDIYRMSIRIRSRIRGDLKRVSSRPTNTYARAHALSTNPLVMNKSRLRTFPLYFVLVACLFFGFTQFFGRVLLSIRANCTVYTFCLPLKSRRWPRNSLFSACCASLRPTRCHGKSYSARNRFRRDRL